MKLGKVARLMRSFFLLLVDCLGYWIMNLLQRRKLASGETKVDKEKVKKILLIRIDRIGDVVLSTPAIRAMKKTFPDSQIDLLVNSYTKELLLNNPHIDNLIIEGDKFSQDYDMAIALHSGMRVNWLTFLSGAQYRGGYSGSGGSFFLTHKKLNDRAQRIRHEVESVLEIVEMMGGVAPEKELEIYLRAEGEEFGPHPRPWAGVDGRGPRRLGLREAERDEGAPQAFRGRVARRIRLRRPRARGLRGRGSDRIPQRDAADVAPAHRPHRAVRRHAAPSHRPRDEAELGTGCDDADRRTTRQLAGRAR